MPGKSKVGSPRTLVSRFWGYVQKSDACWEWTGTRLTSGYGQIDKIAAHRLSWQLHHESPVPDGLFKIVSHSIG
jgi:hypothetical protein